MSLNDFVSKTLDRSRSADSEETDIVFVASGRSLLAPSPVTWFSPQVPTSLPEYEVPSPPAYDSRFVSAQLDPTSGGSGGAAGVGAGGLMTSAAASVASFWRAATGRPN